MRTHDYWPKLKMKNGKKRRVRIIRPTLRELSRTMRALNRNRRGLRGRLHKTRSNDTESQGLINRLLLHWKTEQEKLTRYLGTLFD